MSPLGWERETKMKPEILNANCWILSEYEHQYAGHLPIYMYVIFTSHRGICRDGHGMHTAIYTPLNVQYSSSVTCNV